MEIQEDEKKCKKNEERKGEQQPELQPLNSYYDTDRLFLSSSDRERVYRPLLLLEPFWNPRPRLLTLLFLFPSLLYCSLLLLPPLDAGGTFSLSMRSVS
jgi:hypothetical protein